MTREETIAILKDVVMHTDKLNKDGASIEVVNAMLKSIEELEKLQKIEALYEPKEFGKGLSREERDREVQKILKGNRK